MNKDNWEEIIAYRIGHALYCPECYEKKARELKEFPSKPIYNGMIRVFICEECEAIKGDPKASLVDEKRKFDLLREERFARLELGIPDRFKQLRKLEDLENMIKKCSEKIFFLSSFFIQKLDGEPEINEKDADGMFSILSDITEDLDFVLEELSKKEKRGLIIEKEEAI